jgi:hypothetical protein
MDFPLEEEYRRALSIFLPAGDCAFMHNDAPTHAEYVIPSRTRYRRRDRDRGDDLATSFD